MQCAGVRMNIIVILSERFGDFIFCMQVYDSKSYKIFMLLYFPSDNCR